PSRTRSRGPRPRSPRASRPGSSRLPPVQLLLDRLDDLVADLVHLDALDQLAEEAPHDHAPRVVVGDAAGLEVEQVLVVEPAGRRGVPGAGDLAGEDLQV